MRIWFFDFDGTLSEIVADRTAAQLQPECAVMLKRLADMPSEKVVVISSRGLDDIAARVNVADVFIGGCSGTEWLLPGGCRIRINGNQEAALERSRRELLPELLELTAVEGIDIEDKRWSVAIHTRTASEGVRQEVLERLTLWSEKRGLNIYRGHSVVDVQMIPNFNKSIGIVFLTGFMKVNSERDRIVYAGDDENDAVAMRWTMQQGGTAIMVREQLSVPGARYVTGPSDLVRMVEGLCEADLGAAGRRPGKQKSVGRQV